jgi:hypothetical protein
MSIPSFFRLRRTAFVAASIALAACSPTFNWRDAPVGDAGVIVLLPCKPDHATRQVPLGSEAVPVDMAGCKAGGATFAVAHATASSAEQAESWMRAWRTATRTQLATKRVVEAPAAVPRAAASPAPARLDTQGPPAESRDEAAHVLWFAQQRPDGMAIYQATVLGSPSSSEALTTFFEGIRIP